MHRRHLPIIWKHTYNWAFTGLTNKLKLVLVTLFQKSYENINKILASISGKSKKTEAHAEMQFPYKQKVYQIEVD